MTLDNYDGLTDLREHVQNMHRNLELVIQDDNAMCKILSMTFIGLTRVWYNNLKLVSIMDSNNFCAKLVSWFNTYIPVKKSFIELFSITQLEGGIYHGIFKEVQRRNAKGGIIYWADILKNFDKWSKRTFFMEGFVYSTR